VNVLSQNPDHKFNGGSGVYLGTRGLQKQASIGESAKEEVLEYEVESKEVLEMRQAFSPLRDVRPDIIKQLLTAAEESRYGCVKNR
jgi:hypothetical protein